MPRGEHATVGHPSQAGRRTYSGMEQTSSAPRYPSRQGHRAREAGERARQLGHKGSERMFAPRIRRRGRGGGKVASGGVHAGGQPTDPRRYERDRLGRGCNIPPCLGAHTIPLTARIQAEVLAGMALSRAPQVPAQDGEHASRTGDGPALPSSPPPGRVDDSTPSDSTMSQTLIAAKLHTVPRGSRGIGETLRPVRLARRRRESTRGGGLMEM